MPASPDQAASRRLHLGAASAAFALSIFIAASAATQAGGSGPVVAWSRIRNPILGSASHAIKDPAVVWAAGRWQALFSSVDAAGRWRIGTANSPDLAHWSPARQLPHDPGVEGEASPDVVAAPDGSYVVTYQSSLHDVDGGQSKLYYRTTTDFRTYSSPRPLAHELHPAPSDRMIDGALAWTPAGLLLGYKYGPSNGSQAFEIARSATGSLDGPWQLVGRPNITVYGDTIENYQFLHLEAGWQLLATSNRFDRPFLFSLAGNPTISDGWLDWVPGRQLEIPQERWNPGRGVTGATYEHANCAFLVNRAPIDGRFYLVYADAPEMTRFGGQGHARLGLARSTDLVRWTVPPG